jgi:hypothetical protein
LADFNDLKDAERWKFKGYDSIFCFLGGKTDEG